MCSCGDGEEEWTPGLEQPLWAHLLAAGIKNALPYSDVMKMRITKYTLLNAIIIHC